MWNFQLHKTNGRATAKGRIRDAAVLFFEVPMRNAHCSECDVCCTRDRSRTRERQIKMHAKDSQHDCRTRSQSAWKTSALYRHLSVLFFSPLFFVFFAPPGCIHSDSRSLGLAGTFARATTFVSDVNFCCEAHSRYWENRERGVLSPVGGRKTNLGLILEQNKIAPCK